ncbi:MAG TPA: peptidase inhibitor family I36 protein [Pseudolysinimonas sp.]|nr:peptidase inhibitor family I36 protein [Pseudolysinimonas sp.]
MAALTASIALLVLGAAVPAHATSPDEHCIVYLDDDVVVCAETLEDADAAFTESTGLTRVESSEEDGAGPLTVYSLATLYVDVSYGGSSYTFTRSTPCNGVTLSSVPNLGTYGLNDAVSSFATYSTCQVRLYADISYGGSTYGYATSQSSLPTFNDVASSARAR